MEMGKQLKERIRRELEKIGSFNSDGSYSLKKIRVLQIILIVTQAVVLAFLIHLEMTMSEHIQNSNQFQKEAIKRLEYDNKTLEKTKAIDFLKFGNNQ